MTQTLMDTLAGVELRFPENTNFGSVALDFRTGDVTGFWLIETELSPVRRWSGVDMKNDWILVKIGICEDECWGYITIHARTIPGITEAKLRELYRDIARRLGAVEVTFNGEPI